MAVAISLDNQKIANGSVDMTVKLWEAQSGKLLKTFEGHIESVASVAFSFDNNKIASGADDGNICLGKCRAGHTSKRLRDIQVGCILLGFHLIIKHLAVGHVITQLEFGEFKRKIMIV